MCRFKNKKGFSLIELMVVVAIMGILASIGIPQYLAYRNRAQYGALGTEATNIARVFMTCISTSPFNACDDLEALDVDSDVTGQTANYEGASSPNFCVDFERTIGADMVKSCVSINATDQEITYSTNRPFCYTPKMTGSNFTVGGKTGCTCTYNAGYDTFTSAPSCSGGAPPTTARCPSEELQIARPCTSDSFCDGFKTGDKCQATSTLTGECDTAMGTCG